MSIRNGTRRICHPAFIGPDCERNIFEGETYEPDPATLQPDAERSFLFKHLGTCQRPTPRTRADSKVRKDASHPDRSGDTPDSAPAFGVRRLACAQNLPKIDPRSGAVDARVGHIPRGGAAAAATGWRLRPRRVGRLRELRAGRGCDARGRDRRGRARVRHAVRAAGGVFAWRRTPEGAECCSGRGRRARPRSHARAANAGRGRVLLWKGPKGAASPRAPGCHPLLLALSSAF